AGSNPAWVTTRLRSSPRDSDRAARHRPAAPEGRPPQEGVTAYGVPHARVVPSRGKRSPLEGTSLPSVSRRGEARAPHRPEQRPESGPSRPDAATLPVGTRLAAGSLQVSPGKEVPCASNSFS